MSKYKGLFTFDEDNHKYIPIGQADGIIDTMDYEPDSKSAEPLIKDEKIRKAVRAWAEVHGETEFDVNGGCLVTTFKGLHSLLEMDVRCSWTRNGIYTMDELCGEEEE